MEITFESKAWISSYNRATPDELQTQEGAATLYYNPKDICDGYTFAGNATITLDLCDSRTLVNNKIEALREQAAGIRAEATQKCTRIEGQIQQLLCIENSVAPVD